MNDGNNQNEFHRYFNLYRFSGFDRFKPIFIDLAILIGVSNFYRLIVRKVSAFKKASKDDPGL